MTRISPSRSISQTFSRLIVAAFGILCASTAQCLGTERITQFDSSITVHSNATVEVLETISVTVEGNKIKHGIYRDFPTRYRDRFGNKVRIDFDVIEVTRNGGAETYVLKPWRSGKSAHRGIRVRIGNDDVKLPHEPQTYQIRYRTSRQLGYFEEHDELYWNVTGNEWGLVIERASARVHLPTGIETGRVTSDAYTGRFDEQGTDFRGAVERDRTTLFETTRALAPGERLSIVVGWPKGHVYQPAPLERFLYILRDNRPALAAFIGLGASLLYYLVGWLQFGKDPAKGVIVPLYEPPGNLSPGAVRYIWKMSYDNKCFAAALIHLGVTGHLRMSERDGEYTITRLDGSISKLQPDEKKLFRTLLGSRSKLTFKPDNHPQISAAVNAFKGSLAGTYKKKCFVSNLQYWWPGVLIALCTLAAAILLGHDLILGLFMGGWLSVWTVGVVFLGHLVYRAWAGILSGPSQVRGGCGAVLITAFALPFFIGEVVGLYMLSKAISPAAAILLIGQAGLILLFYHLMKAPTLLGRKLMDQLEGFRRYLCIAEHDRLALRHPAKKTPEHYEEFLPYALALDVEQEWAEYFADVIEKMPGAKMPQAGASWYSSSSGQHPADRAFANSLGGSLVAAISSSSRAPGSSSGFSGGGSSGGAAGGGGGGGGW